MRPSLKGLSKRAAESAGRAAEGSPVPAGQDTPTAEQLQRPGARERGAMRRRLRRLRRTREALVTDLGGLVVELHRHGRAQSPLIGQRVEQVAAIDAEMRGLAQALGSELTLSQVVVAGIAGACSRCGSLLSTSDRFCAHCGTAATPIADGRAGERQSAPPPAVPAAAAGAKPPPPTSAKPLTTPPTPPPQTPAPSAGDAPKPPPPAHAQPLGTDAPPPTADGGHTARTPAAS
jgi:zinc ribbon protein